VRDLHIHEKPNDFFELPFEVRPLDGNASYAGRQPVGNVNSMSDPRDRKVGHG
jgi:hypothetical protein